MSNLVSMAITSSINIDENAQQEKDKNKIVILTENLIREAV